jgi:methionyl-tRNA formyltransferase
MKIVFMGTPNFSVKILQQLHETYTVDLVVTQPDKLVGRKKVLTFSPVKELALELGVEVFQPRKIKDDFERILEVQPDIIITAAYGQLIPKEVLEYPELGAINVHGSLLPLLRGGAPIQRAIQRLHNTTGITIMYMAQRMDSGDIISQRSIPILNTDTNGTLFNKLSVLGRDLLMDTLPSIIDKTNNRTKQDEHFVTFAYNIKREEERIDWSMSKEKIDAHIRAFSPSPSTYTTLDGKQIKILRVAISTKTLREDDNSLENGTIREITEDSIKVKVNNGYIKIQHLQLAGKKDQYVKVFMNGAGRNIIKIDKIFK